MAGRGARGPYLDGWIGMLPSRAAQHGGPPEGSRVEGFEGALVGAGGLLTFPAAMETFPATCGRPAGALLRMAGCQPG